jgi:hypothetical protein
LVVAALVAADLALLAAVFVFDLLSSVILVSLHRNARF